MIGAIIGDFVGSVHEHIGTKRKDFPLIAPTSTVTDDSILTVAIAEWVLTGRDLTTRFHELVAEYPNSGWGHSFYYWARDRRREPYQSYGNGAAMRVSAVGWAFATEAETLKAAADSAAPTHDHPEGIKGAQATALAIFMARTGSDKEAIRREVSRRFGYSLNRTVDGIRPNYSFDVTCQGTVPEALVAFFDATSFEDTIRNAISLGGDADTLACIAGAVAHAFYRDVPGEAKAAALASLPPPLLPVWDEFRARFAVPG